MKYAILTIAIAIMDSARKKESMQRRIRKDVCSVSVNGDTTIERAHKMHSISNPPNKPNMMGEINGIIFFITLTPLISFLIIIHQNAPKCNIPNKFSSTCKRKIIFLLRQSFHVTATGIGTAKLYAQDWNENGKRDECTVTVVTPYEKRLQDLAGFSNDATALILKLYNKVDNIFSSENALQKAWRCARLLSEFSYNSFSFNDVAGSLTNQNNRQSYFMTTLGYTENEYTTLSVALSDNHSDSNTIDFTHLQYSLAARLAYTLDKDDLASNLGSQFKTGNWGIYSDEDISYLGGWLGDATLRNDGGTGVPSVKVMFIPSE